MVNQKDAVTLDYRTGCDSPNIDVNSYYECVSGIQISVFYVKAYKCPMKSALLSLSPPNCFTVAN